MTRFNPQVWASVIEWASDQDNDGPAVHLAATKRLAQEMTINFLRNVWRETPSLFRDDAPRFMEQEGYLYTQPISTWSTEAIEDWLAEFHIMTTAPWVTITEKEVSL